MDDMDDMGLLREYALRNSEPAFATLVARHIDLVYSAALRHLGHHHRAEEITQAVFVILARRARSLGPGTVLPGWLFQTTRLTAANYLRTEIRRARREQEAYMQSNPDENSSDVWQQMAPMLNDVIAGLGEKDRNAIVLRFLKGKEYKEVAAALGGTEEAAQMRVSRALEKLRKLFARRGVVLTTAGLSSVITSHVTQAAPIGFAASVAATAVQDTALTAATLTLVKGTLKVMAWTKVKFAIGASVVALLAYQYHQNSAQARQLASARENLRGSIEALAAQESRIAGLEQQTAAMVENRRSQELELERLRARRKATANPDRSRSAARAPTTLLSATLQDPEAREILRRQMVEGYRFRYGPFAEDLHVGPEEGEKLVQAAGDGAIKILEAVAAFTDGKITADAALKVEAEAIQNGTNQVRLTLGEEALAKFEDYTRTYPARALVEQFNNQLGPFPISADQRARLSEVFLAEPIEVTRQLAGEIPVELVVSPEQINRRFEQQAAINRRILEKAAEFLAPDQLETLALIQTNNLTAQKRDVLRMLRKF